MLCNKWWLRLGFVKNTFGSTRKWRFNWRWRKEFFWKWLETELRWVFILVQVEFFKRSRFKPSEKYFRKRYFLYVKSQKTNSFWSYKALKTNNAVAGSPKKNPNVANCCHCKNNIKFEGSNPSALFDPWRGRFFFRNIRFITFFSTCRNDFMKAY